MRVISEVRQLTGLSHKHLAEWLGVSRSLVQFAEKGERSLPTDTLMKLKSILSTLKQLAKETREKPKTPVLGNPSALAKLHRKKISLHENAATSLRWQLRKLEKKNSKLKARGDLFAAIKEQRSDSFKLNKHDETWIGFAEFFLQIDLKKTGQEKQDLLREKIEMHEAYAALHRERELKYLTLQQQSTKE